eukprot:73704_1
MLSLVAFLFCITTIFSQNTPPYTTYWYTQRLDHFDPQNNVTFSQRYLVYDGAFNKSKNVIFFYAGNEGPIDAFYNNTGFMFDIAPDFGALVIFCEHRYYGETHPFGNDFSASAMKYLTMENAVADYAQFMTDMKTKFKLQNAKVIVFGGSYGGILAALCRIHYPAIFDMALAASAPIPQTLNSVNGTIFFRLVTNDYYNVNSQCPDIVRQGYAQMINLAANNKYDEISNTFSLCSPIKNQADLLYLEEWARNGLLTMAMVDYPYAADFLGKLPAYPVNASCKLMLENKANPMKALAAGAGLYYNASYDNTLTCFNITAEFIECADQTGCGLGTDATAWDYQMCTEIVYSMVTNNITDMFPPFHWDIHNLTKYCNQVYGVTPEPDQMQVWFPLDVGDATSRIIFSNGLLDPWHGGGYLTPPGPELPTVIIPSGAHHLDLRGKNPNDPPDVTDARQKEVQILQNWLKETQE